MQIGQPVFGCVWAGQAFRGHFGGVWAFGRLVDVSGAFWGRLVGGSRTFHKCPRGVLGMSTGCPRGVRWVSGCPGAVRVAWGCLARLNTPVWSLESRV